MSVRAVNQNAASQGSKSLPSDVEEVVGSINIKITNVFAKIKAFFSVLVNESKPCHTFCQSIDVKAKEISNAKQFDLYKKYKKLDPYKRAFMELTGYEIYTDEQMAPISKLSNEMQVLGVFHAVENREDVSKIKSLLGQIKRNNSSNYFAVLFALRRFAASHNPTPEIMNLIDAEFATIPQDKKNSFYAPQKPELAKFKTWHKVAIGVLIAAGVIGAGYGAYTLYGSYQAAARDARIKEAAKAAYNPKVFKGPVSSPDTPEGKAALKAYYAEKAQEANYRREMDKSFKQMMSSSAVMNRAARLTAEREASIRAAHNPKVFTGPVSSPDTPEGQAALVAYHAEKAQEAEKAARLAEKAQEANYRREMDKSFRQFMRSQSQQSMLDYLMGLPRS